MTDIAATVELAQEPLFQWLAQFAYQPELLYALVIGMMFLSSFGVPIPEEVTLLTLGFFAFVGSHPELFPPPDPNASVVKVYMACIVATLAVFVSDMIVFMLGRKLGRRVLYSEKLKKIFKEEAIHKVELWVEKYGAFAAGIFRFTPGLRFPGHMACGSLGLSPIKFMMVDGIAVLISVPTQIYLIATYGNEIIGFIKRFQAAIIVAGAIILTTYIITKYIKRR